MIHSDRAQGSPVLIRPSDAGVSAKTDRIPLLVIARNEVPWNAGKPGRRACFICASFRLRVPAVEQQKKVPHPTLWVISNFIAMGIPFSMVIWVSTRLFKDLGHSDSEITVPVAAIGIVWSLKPLWAGFLDMFKTKKFFVLSTEFIIGVLFVLMGLALNLDSYFATIVAIMWVVAFASATQDICSDGIYISTLDKARQAAYIGVQGMAWNLGRIIAVSGVVWLAGYLQEDACLSPKTSWIHGTLARKYRGRPIEQRTG